MTVLEPQPWLACSAIPTSGVAGSVSKLHVRDLVQPAARQRNDVVDGAVGYRHALVADSAEIAVSGSEFGDVDVLDEGLSFGHSPARALGRVPAVPSGVASASVRSTPASVAARPSRELAAVDARCVAPRDVRVFAPSDPAASHAASPWVPRGHSLTAIDAWATRLEAPFLETSDAESPSGYGSAVGADGRRLTHTLKYSHMVTR